MVKARWRMFQNGDYVQNVAKITSEQQLPRFKTPRNVAVVDTNNNTLTVNLTTTQKVPGIIYSIFFWFEFLI